MAKDNFMLSMRMETLTIFHGLLEDPVIKALRDMLYASDKAEHTLDAIRFYSTFVSMLYESCPDLSKYITDLVLDNENFYIRQYAADIPLSDSVKESLLAELDLLQELTQLTSKEVQRSINYHGFLPQWDNSPVNLKYKYMARLETLPEKGFGIYAKYHTFSVKDGKITPVLYPDPQRLSDLFGYQRQKQQIIANVNALLKGTGCNNMLLYGDAGTGKSSTIKAVANVYAKKGLRLVEVTKQEIHHIPAITDTLGTLPLKFILFIDDLSFSKNDDNFSALKAILEGGVSSNSKNIAIFATSNRRHLIKEQFRDREGDDLHLNDTLQETTSLAARFGLTITFQQPSKEEYLSIVDQLAGLYRIDMDSQLLHQKAETHALRNNGRTPRLAKQFMELLKSGI